MTQTQKQKRAIFVGETATHAPDSTELRYGLTGVIRPTILRAVFDFCPDGTNDWWSCERDELYIASEDKKRYCPKP